MRKVYINYGNPEFSVYKDDLSSAQIKKHNVEGQRNLKIDSSNYIDSLNDFNQNYKFNTKIKHENDMWITIDTNHTILDEKIQNQILDKLKKRYKSFTNNNYKSLVA